MYLTHELQESGISTSLYDSCPHNFSIAVRALYIYLNTSTQNWPQTIADILLVLLTMFKYLDYYEFHSMAEDIAITGC